MCHRAQLLTALHLLCYFSFHSYSSRWAECSCRAEIFARARTTESKASPLLMWPTSGTGRSHLLPASSTCGYQGAWGQGCLFAPFLLVPGPSKALPSGSVGTSSSEKPDGLPSAFQGLGPGSCRVGAAWALGHHSRGFCVISWPGSRQAAEVARWSRLLKAPSH